MVSVSVFCCAHSFKFILHADEVGFTSGGEATMGQFPADSLMLDGNVFVNCVFTNTTVMYDGGPVYLDKTNHAINSHAVEGPNSRNRRDILKSLIEIVGSNSRLV
jgi:hypothetical protein